MSRLRANQITNKTANGAPTATNGLIVTGVCTATSFVGSGTALTGIDAATLKFGNATKAEANNSGVVVTGVLTATSGVFSGNLGVGGVLTYEDVTNIDSVGLITARAGVNLVGNDLNVGSNIKIGNASGIVTATSFSGSGANLTGINTAFGSGTSVNTTGIITASHFVPTTQGSLGKRNLILNGEFQIDERMGGSATAITPTGGVDYTCDMWHESNYGGEAARITYQQRSGDTPTPNYRQAIRLDVTTAMGTPSGNNWMGFSQFIESQNIHFLGHGTSSAKPITLQFWVKSTKTGTATVGITRSDAAREYLAEYTISASDTWEFKTITFPGDTSGTEAAGDNGRGFMIYWCLFAGSTRHGTLNNWRTYPGGYYGASANQVNLLDSTSNFVLFAGIQLEVGNVATPFEHQTFSQDLHECRRYFYKVHPDRIYGTRWGNSSSMMTVFYPTQMRDAPTTIGGSPRSGGGTEYKGKDYFGYLVSGQDAQWWDNFTASAHL